METALALILPGLLGGVVVAAVLALLNRTPTSKLSHHAHLEPISPDAINMAHIRVAGVGGLGMMAVALIIAINLPEIGVAMLIAFTLGIITACALIAGRSRSNARAAGGDDELPPSMLSLDSRPRHGSGGRPELRRNRVAVVV